MKHEVICQDWTESEQGWGQRPDGVSLHLNENNRATFFKDYQKRLPKEIPHEYSFPEENIYVIKVDDNTFERIKETKNGLRLFQSEFRTLKYKKIDSTEEFMGNHKKQE